MTTALRRYNINKSGNRNYHLTNSRNTREEGQDEEKAEEGEEEEGEEEKEEENNITAAGAVDQE